MSESFEPRDYQMEALQLMVRQSSLGLAMDPGLGKTATWLAAFTTLQKLGFADKMLVVVPLKPMYDTWPKQIDKYEEFNHLTWCFLHGPDKDWHLANTKADIYLINPEGLKWLVEKRGHDPSKLADILCIDESTRFKRSTTKMFKMMRPFWHRFKYRWLGSGTFCPNSLEDLFAQNYILDSGQALGRFVTHFRNKYCYQEPWDPYTNHFHDWAHADIMERIAPLWYVKEADYDFELLVVDKEFDLPPKAMKMYKEIEEEFIFYENEDDPEPLLLAASNAAASTKCRQICNGAAYSHTTPGRVKQDEYVTIHDEKLDLMDELLDEIGEHPALIVYEFKHDKHRITRRHLGWPDLTGMNGECLNYTIQQFNEGKIPRLLLQSGAAHGLNIQGAARHMIFFGLTWNWEDYKQVVDRLYRQGQKASMVLVYRLLARGTVEERVAEALRIKYERERTVKTDLKSYRGRG